MTASPQIHVNVRHLFSPLGPEELNYNFVPTSAHSNLTLPEMRRCLGIKDQRLSDWGRGGGPEAGVDDAFPILSGPCGAGAQGWLGVVRRRGRSLGGEVKMMRGTGGSALHREIPPVRSAVFAALPLCARPHLGQGGLLGGGAGQGQRTDHGLAEELWCAAGERCDRRKAGTKSLRLEAAWCSQETDELCGWSIVWKGRSGSRGAPGRTVWDLVLQLGPLRSNGSVLMGRRGMIQCVQ